MFKANIVFAVDNFYVEQLCVAIISLLRNNNNLKIYIINNGLNDFHRLTKLTENYCCQIVDIKIQDKQLEDLPISHHINISTYYRLLIPELVNEDKVLYLDSDLIVNGSIYDLYHVDISRHYLAAVENSGPNSHASSLGLKNSSDYFNAGVMLMNLELFRLHNIADKALLYIRNNQSLIKLWDQDGLNAIVDGKWVRVNKIFNAQTGHFNVNYSMLEDDPIIIHFTTSDKPWHFGNRHPYKSLYWHYLRFTPCNRVFPHKILPGVKTIILAIVVNYFPIKIVGLLKKIKSRL